MKHISEGINAALALYDEDDANCFQVAEKAQKSMENRRDATPYILTTTSCSVTIWFTVLPNCRREESETRHLQKTL